MPSTPKPKPATPRWASWTDDRLLELRLCDLQIELDDCPDLLRNLDQLNDELTRRGIQRFRPHAWLSSEWFSPDGIPGIALPFYLAHPRLAKLEKAQMLTVEGGTKRTCMRILRHEAGHTLCSAYRLHRRRKFRELFGSVAEPYPETYRPNPGSRDYVTHLDAWYAQAHPAEDFAETFAVWLGQPTRWRKTYARWPALRKLEYLDEVVQEIGQQPPPIRTRRKVEPLSQLRTTLAKHYQRRRWFYADSFPDFYDRDLLKIFSPDAEFALRPTAASFLRKARPELRDDVARWTGAHAYSIDQVLRDMIDRSHELKLRLAVPEAQAKRDARMMLTVQTMNYLHAGHHPVAL
ncbi:MAG: putative zinc-binding metallopeptidase [Phycisphaerales bacterium JB063]